MRVHEINFYHDNTKMDKNRTELLLRSLILFAGVAGSSGVSFGILYNEFSKEYVEEDKRQQKKDTSVSTDDAYIQAILKNEYEPAKPPEKIEEKSTISEIKKRRRERKIDEAKLRMIVSQEVDWFIPMSIGTPIILLSTFLLVFIRDLIIDSGINGKDLNSVAKVSAIKASITASAVTLVFMLTGALAKPERKRRVVFNSLFLGMVAVSVDGLLENLLYVK